MKRLILLISISCMLLESTFIALGWLRFLLIPASPDTVYWRVITIPRGKPFSEICTLLEREKIVTNASKLTWFGRLSGASHSIRAGDFRLSPHLSPANIIDILSHGTPHLYRVRIQEGWTIHEIAQELVREGIVYDANDIISLAFDRDFARAAGIESYSVEGYLFPDSYYFARGTNPAIVLNTMIRQFWSVFNEEFRSASRARSLTTHENVTLASIIERESGWEGELPLISAVFHNRLKKEMRLQADPTVIYGVRMRYKGNLTKADLLAYSPYNTYRIKGLPPGPIGSPGRKAIHAALFPSKHDYLYFVSKRNGTHAFASSLREHINNIHRYQLDVSAAPVETEQTQNLINLN